MNLASAFRLAAGIVVLPAILAAQESQSSSSTATGAAPVATKLAIIDIDRIAAESASGKAILEVLKQENDRITQERLRREQEIREMQQKMGSDVLSVDARERLNREVERKRTEAQRWFEDAQREFQEKQADSEEEFQRKLGPIVDQLARENGIGLIIRFTPGLTLLYDPSIDISPLVVRRLNEMEAAGTAPTGDASQSQSSGTTQPPPRD